MNIRVMRIADYDAVYALWLRCSGMGLNDLDDSREGMEKYLKRNPYTCFVAEDEAGVVGVIRAGHDGRRGYIYHTAVDPQKRGRGIGRALIQRALGALHDQGIHKAALVVFSRNEAGNAFWEKMGCLSREDLTYRNIALDEMKRIDT